MGVVKVVPSQHLDDALEDSLSLFGVKIETCERLDDGMISGLILEVVVPGSSEVKNSDGEELAGDTLGNMIENMLNETTFLKDYSYTVDPSVHWTMDEFNEALDKSGMDRNEVLGE